MVEDVEKKRTELAAQWAAQDLTKDKPDAQVLHDRMVADATASAQEYCDTMVATVLEGKNLRDLRFDKPWHPDFVAQSHMDKVWYAADRKLTEIGFRLVVEGYDDNSRRSSVNSRSRRFQLQFLPKHSENI